LRWRDEVEVDYEAGGYDDMTLDIEIEIDIQLDIELDIFNLIYTDDT